MKYEFSTAETTIDGEVYKVCTICGKKQKNNYGFEFDFKVPSYYGHARYGLCRKCANNIRPAIMKFFQELDGRNL